MLFVSNTGCILLALYLGVASCVFILAPQSAMAQFLRQQPELTISHGFLFWSGADNERDYR